MRKVTIKVGKTMHREVYFMDCGLLDSPNEQQVLDSIVDQNIHGMVFKYFVRQETSNGNWDDVARRSAEEQYKKACDERSCLFRPDPPHIKLGEIDVQWVADVYLQ